MKNLILFATTCTLLAATTLTQAAVPASEAAKLGNSLTPIGAEKAGNADGSIPPWTGGLPENAGSASPTGNLSDPFAGEKPLFTISPQNVAQYQDKLTPGQQALFKRYPDSFHMRVFPSHRSAALPDSVNQAIAR